MQHAGSLRDAAPRNRSRCTRHPQITEKGGYRRTLLVMSLAWLDRSWGCTVSDTALVLAKYIEHLEAHEPGRFEGKRVLELSADSGLAGDQRH